MFALIGRSDTIEVSVWEKARDINSTLEAIISIILLKVSHVFRTIQPDDIIEFFWAVLIKRTPIQPKRRSYYVRIDL